MIRSNEIILRDVVDKDLNIFFNQQKDRDAIWMAAFISRDPEDRNSYDQHWIKVRKDKQNDIKTILFNGKVAGNIVSYIMDERRNIGYWLGKEFWGKGIASQALKLFIDEIKERPLFAHVAFDNIGSIRVLEKCGFNKIGEESYFAKARDKEIQEYIYRLD